MNFQSGHLRLFNFIYIPFLVGAKSFCIKSLYQHSVLFTSIVVAASKVLTITPANNPTFQKKEITHGN